jgi:hypothetical protein
VIATLFPYGIACALFLMFLRFISAARVAAECRHQIKVKQKMAGESKRDLYRPHGSDTDARWRCMSPGDPRHHTTSRKGNPCSSSTESRSGHRGEDHRGSRRRGGRAPACSPAASGPCSTARRSPPSPASARVAGTCKKQSKPSHRPSPIDLKISKPS